MTRTCINLYTVPSAHLATDSNGLVHRPSSIAMDASIRNGQGLGQGALGGVMSSTANPTSSVFTTAGGGFTTGQSRHSTLDGLPDTR